MALAIIILIIGAAGAFAWLSRPFSDLIPMVAPAAEIAAPEEGDAPPPADNPEPQGQAVVAEEPAAETPVPTIAASESTDNEFAPTHQISSESINFRAGPSTSDQIIVVLPPATPLQYLEEDAPTSSPSDGERWMRFRTEDGREGWVREIDTEPYQP